MLQIIFNGVNDEPVTLAQPMPEKGFIRYLINIIET